MTWVSDPRRLPEKRVTIAQKRTIAKRARECCEYCRSPVDFSPDAFSVEHIEPRQRGGKTTLDNLALSCQGCNNHKHTKTRSRDPVSETLVPLYNPRRH